MSREASVLKRALDITAPFKRMDFQGFMNEFRADEIKFQKGSFSWIKKLIGRNELLDDYQKSRFEWHKMHRIWDKVAELVQGDVELVGRKYLSFEDWIKSGKSYLYLCKRNHHGVIHSLDEAVDFAMQNFKISNLTRDEARDFILFSDYNEIYIRTELEHVKTVFESLKPDMSKFSKIIWSFSWPNISDYGHLGCLIHVACAFPITFSNGETSLDILNFSADQRDLVLAALICRWDWKKKSITCFLDTRKQFEEWLSYECNIYPSLEVFPIPVR